MNPHDTRSTGAFGGRKAAELLTPAERKQKAQAAAKARWAKRETTTCPQCGGSGKVRIPAHP